MWVYGPGLKRLLLLGFTGLGFRILSVWSGHRGCMRARPGSRAGLGFRVLGFRVLGFRGLGFWGFGV